MEDEAAAAAAMDVTEDRELLAAEATAKRTHSGGSAGTGSDVEGTMSSSSAAAPSLVLHGLSFRATKRPRISADLSSSATLQTQSAGSELAALGVVVVNQADVEEDIIHRLDDVLAEEELAKRRQDLALAKIEIKCVL
jgi:hypothetical protein